MNWKQQNEAAKAEAKQDMEEWRITERRMLDLLRRTDRRLESINDSITGLMMEPPSEHVERDAALRGKQNDREDVENQRHHLCHALGLVVYRRIQAEELAQALGIEPKPTPARK
jgi:hypothetical protein